MSAKRRRDHLKTTGRDQTASAPVFEPSDEAKEFAAAVAEKDAEEERKRFYSDPLAFYKEIFAPNSIDKGTGKAYKDMIGKIHLFMLDFLCLEMPDVKRYSPLCQYLPKQTPDGGYEERWLYWRTLDGSPLIQDGPDGPISTQYLSKPWQGLTIRLRGILDKSLQVPRGHLKSEVGTKMFVLWKMIREPQDRHLVNSAIQPLSRKFLKHIKFHFERNPQFRALWGHLKPEGKDSSWNADFIQLELGDDVPRGSDATCEAMGLGGDGTGTHFDDMTFDDVVTSKNTGGELTEKTNEAIMMLQAIRDPRSPQLDIGTPYAEDDGHSLFTRPGGAFYDDSSFFVATLMDGNAETGSIPAHYGIAGRGDPLWPEKFSEAVIQKKRREMPIDRQYFGQYFCQFTGTSEKLFKQEWLRYYEDRPDEIAQKHKCDIYVAFDTASGKIVQKGKFDPSGCLVMGRSTQDETDHFILDGFKEKLPAEELAPAIVDICLRWKRVADRMGTNFRAGFEGTVYTTLLKPLLERELELRGLPGCFSIETLDHGNRAKESRIRMIAGPFSYGWCMLPKQLIKPRVAKGVPYDLTDEFNKEFMGYPMIPHEELLDCAAYLFEMSGIPEFKDRPRGAQRARERSAYVRPTVTIDESGEAVTIEEPQQDDQYSRDDGYALGGY